MAWQHGNMATTKQRSQSVLWIGHRSLVLPRCLQASQPAGRRRVVRTDESTSRRQTPAQPANVAAARHPPLWFFCSSLRPSHASELPCPCCTVLNDTAPYLHGYEIRYTTYAIVSLPGTVHERITTSCSSSTTTIALQKTSTPRHPQARRPHGAWRRKCPAKNTGGATGIAFMRCVHALHGMACTARSKAPFIIICTKREKKKKQPAAAHEDRRPLGTALVGPYVAWSWSWSWSLPAAHALTYI